MPLNTVASLGLVTAVGHDVETACAAFRAGITRLQPLPITTYDPDLQEAPVLGATASPLVDGFVGSGALVRLGQVGLEDLVRFGGLPSDAAFWRSTGLAWCFPEISYERFLWPLDETEEIVERACSRRLADCLDLPMEVLPAANAAQGHTSAAALLARLDRIAAEKKLERFVVLATDNLVDPLALTALSQSMRLKTPANPVGLCPGQAAAALLVQRDTDRFQPACGRQLRIRSVEVRDAPGPLGEEDPMASRTTMAPEIAKSLSQMALAALRPVIGASPSGDVILDLNGEDWRALVWGHTVALMQGQLDLAGLRLVLPSASFGEIGAASPVAALCVAARSFARGYAAGSWALVLSVGDSGATSAILAESP